MDHLPPGRFGRATSRRADRLGDGPARGGRDLVVGLALTAGAFDATLYAVIVGMVVITAVLVPPLMGPLVRRAEPGAVAAATEA